MTTIESVSAQARGTEAEDFESWLAQQLSWLKSYEGPHSRELAQMILEMNLADMTTYLRRLLAAELGDKMAGWLAMATRKKQAYDSDLEQKREALHPERITKTSGMKQLAKKDADDVDDYSSQKAKQVKKQKARQQAEKHREKVERERREKAAETLKSRRQCNCMATEHPLRGNCLRCGKIICELEGDGPCLFCAAYLPPEESNGANAMNSEALRLAIEKKNTILQQAQSKRFTQIIDDQMDHFDMDDRWLSPSERLAMRKEQDARVKAEEEAKRRIGITLDFEGGQIVTTSREEMVKQAIEAHSKLVDVRCSSASSGASSADPSEEAGTEQRMFYNPFLDVEAPVWLAKEKIGKKEPLPVVATKTRTRVQEEENIPRP